MRKATYQFAVTAVLFFSLWFALKSVDWIAVFNIAEKTKNTEEKLGELLWEVVSETEVEVRDKAITTPLDSLFHRICSRNGIDESAIELHVINNEEINAFAMPSGLLVVNTGLISAVENEAELMGVLGHEIAHIQKKHVMKKLIKEIGLSVLVSITAGGGGETISAILKMLSSAAYDREYEREADIASADYMMQADVNPAPFADFLFRMSLSSPDLPEEFYWISTHPESEERAEAILDHIKGKTYLSESVLSEETWSNLKLFTKNL